jgi:hypothetical protein
VNDKAVYVCTNAIPEVPDTSVDGAIIRDTIELLKDPFPPCCPRD